MKRFLLAVLFFAVLIGLWEWAFRAKIWSPVLLPAPQQVAEYLKTAATDGTLFQRYRHYHAPAADRLCHRPYWWIAARAINGALGTFSGHHRDARARIANTAQRVLGPARAFVVWANGGSHALRRGNGNALVGRDRDRYRRAACSADLPAGGAAPWDQSVCTSGLK